MGNAYVTEHRLDRIRIAGFKSIGEMDIELGAVNVLIGANGAGKSNFIGAFALLHDMVEGRLQAHVARRGGADALLHFGQKRTPSMRLDLQFGRNGYRVELAPAAGDALYFEHETYSFQGEGYDKPYMKSLGSGHKESELSDEARREPMARHVLDSIKSWKIYHFHDTSESARVKQKGNIDDNAFLRRDAGNLAAFLYRLQRAEPSAYKKIVATVRMIAPFFDDFALRPDPVRDDRIQLEWRERGSDAYFNAHALSDGTLRFICLATLLLQPELPTAILIDEPELGLHPAAVHHFVALVKAASRRPRDPKSSCQIILSTQSVTMMNQFEPQDLIVVERDGQESIFRRISAEDIAGWIDDYALGELWEKNVIGGRP